MLYFVSLMIGPLGLSPVSILSRDWVIVKWKISAQIKTRTYASPPSVEPMRLLFQQEPRWFGCQHARWRLDVTSSCFYLFQMVFGWKLRHRADWWGERTDLAFSSFLWKHHHGENVIWIWDPLIQHSHLSLFQKETLALSLIKGDKRLVLCWSDYFCFFPSRI